jgi:MraZ protein
LLGIFVGKSVAKWCIVCIFAEMRFLGNIVARLDAKNRVFIPAVFRKQLFQLEGQALYLRKDVYQNCITVYTKLVWEEELQNLRLRLERWDPDEQELYRQFMLEAEEVIPDGSGRILISRNLLNLVGVESEVRFLGMDNMLEIWPKESLEKPRVEPEVFRKRMREIMTRKTTA